MLLFDTSAAIEWLKGNKSIYALTKDDLVAISAVTVYELLWVSKKRGHKAISAVDSFIAGCTIVPISLTISRRAALIKTDLMTHGNDKPMADIMIAATAECEALQLITFDNDFKIIQKVSDFKIKMF